MSADIVWEDPGVSHASTTRGRVVRFVEALKSRPGEWAKYPHELSASSVGSSVTVNSGRFPGTEWTARDVNTDAAALYGRWIGENGEHA